MELLRQAFNTASEISDVAGQATALFNQAVAMDTIGNRAHALELAQSALELFEVADHPAAETVRRRLVEWQ